MKQIVRVIAALAVSVVLGGCAASSIGRGKTDAGVMVANYTNDYVEVSLLSPSGRKIGIGEDAKPFSEGGTGGRSCCAMVPTVGQTMRVELRVGGFNDAADQYKTYNRDVVVKGSPPTDSDHHSYLILRVFQNHEVEAELFPYSNFEPTNPRVDKLFSGHRVMRQVGE